MQAFSILTLACAAIATGSPAGNNRNSTRHALSIGMNTASIGEPSHYRNKNVSLYKLTPLYNIEARELVILSNSTSSADINDIECRAYKDAAGLQPGSAPFSMSKPAELSTNVVTVGSVLCYVAASS